MKKILILWAALLCGSIFHANAQGVQFRHLTYQQALEQAQKENKLVFMDCYTSWCGPCKNMLDNVFTLPEAGEFMNAAFVCVKFDMEKGEGVDLRKQFSVRAFPTFFIIRPDGTVQHRLAGGSQWDRFRVRLQRGIEEKTSFYYLDQCYRKGKLSDKQYALYAEALSDASDKKKVEQICMEVFTKLSDKAKCRKENWFIFDQEITPADQRFVYLVGQKPAFDASIGRETVEQKIYSVYSDALTALNRAKSNEWPVGVATITNQLKDIEFEGKQQIQYFLDYVVACRTKDIEGVLNSLEKHEEDLPKYTLMDLPFHFDFIVREGSNEQLERYIRLGREGEKRTDSPQFARLMGEFFDKHQGELNDRTAYAEIKGKVSRDNMEEVRLYEVVDGKECLLSTTRIGKEGWYGFSFQPSYSGFYTVGGEKPLDRIRLYLKPGDRAEMNILQDSLMITSRNTFENLLLAQWESLIIPVREKTDGLKYVLFDYRDFFPYFMNFLPQAQEFKEKIATRNEDFNGLLRQAVDFDLDYYAFRILNALKAGKDTHRPSRPAPADYPEYYKTIVGKAKLADASVLRQPYGYDYLQRYTTFALAGERAKATLADRLERLPNDLLKAEMVLWYAERCKTYEEYMNIVQKYAAYLTTANHRQRMDGVSAKLYKGTKGEEAANFTYPDRNGKQVSLSDFRGKVVLVDVWATWCGPCRAEVPHLVKLEKEMEGKDVVFIGVSVDEKKDHQKWLDVLDQEGMHGIQLFASGWSKICQDYKIKGIPRFMVFDRAGNVVSIDSPRPSNPELKKLLEKTLKD